MPRALIVEDEPQANQLLSMLVQLRGYRTDSAFTGGEALEKVGRDTFDIVFLDLMLPDINGYDVCRALKDGKATSLIPVVMVTARVAAENRLQSFGVGADGYIPKPYTPDQIFRAMADADDWRHSLDRREAEGEIRLDAGPDGDSPRQLAQLRNLLVGRSTLGLDSVCRIVAALAEIAADARDWGSRHHVGLVATLRYRLQPDRIVLTLRDASGWLRESPIAREPGRSETLAAVRFDEVVPDEGAGELTFLKRFPPP